MRHVFPAIAAFSLALPAFAQNPETAASRLRLGWDENYLYAAFNVVDSDVRGTNDKPFSNPLEDDSVGIYIRTGGEAGAKPDANSHALLVSAAGGMTFLKGENGNWTPDRKFSMKFGVDVDGTLNTGTDRDRGYSVEVAIPWALLGLNGKTVNASTVLSGCVLTRKRGGSILPFPEGSDTNEPSTWPRISLADGVEGKLRAFQLPAPPVIDGKIGGGEWRSDGVPLPTSDDVPTTVDATTPVALSPVPGVTDQVPSLAGLKPQELPGQVFARYLPFFQADPTKPYPVRGILGEAGQVLFADQPEGGIGPWFSTDRVGWHRGELASMKRIGIDAALVEMGGPDSPTAFADEKTLLNLVAALREMSRDRQLAPTVTPFLDTAYLAPTAQRPDLTTSAGRESVWKAIKRWMSIVPPEYRTRIPLPGGGNAYPIFFTDGANLQNVTATGWADVMRQRFAEEFGALSNGATLLFVGGKNFALSENIIGALPLGTGKGTGALPLSVISPGSQTPLIPRKLGDTYRTSWTDAIEAKSTWLVLNSWNDFGAGNELTATRQYGDAYLDATRIQLVRASSNRDWGVRLVDSDVPRTLKAGELFPTRLTLQSVGLTPLRGTAVPVLSYRWEQGGKVVAKSPVPIRPNVTLLATQSATVKLGVASLDEKNAPLPPGEYTLVLEAASPDGKPADTLTMPVRVEPKRVDAVEFQGTTTTSLLQSGATYPTTVTLRWLGDAPLNAGDGRLLCQILSADGRSVLRSELIPLDVTLTPGVWTTIRASFKTVDSAGAPLKPAMPENASQTYDENALRVRMRWALVRGAGGVLPGGYEEGVAIYPGDDEASVQLEAFPETGAASAIIPAQLTVVNRGPFPWAKGQYALSVHWCYADGFPLKRNATAQVIQAFPKEIVPGEALPLSLPTRLPDRAGRYVAVFSVVRLTPQGPVFLEGSLVTRSGDIATATMDVTGGRITALDLGKLFDTDAASTEDAPEDGNLDGKGSTLPAEWLAPDRFGRNRSATLIPSGYYSEISSAARGVAFRYGPTTKGQKNAMTAKGQELPLERGRYFALHIAALATGDQPAPLTVTLKYADGKTEEQKINVESWLKPNTINEAVALGLPRKRTPKGDTPETPLIRHYVIGLSASKDLVSATVGHQDQVKIFAVTLEK